jgi:hypothetical protein
MLQFVSGLGARKAASLLSAVARQPGGFVESRMQVYKKLGVMEKTVFINCGPFLRIRKAGQGMTNLNLDCMDDTRIHPLNYKWAIKIAQDVRGPSLRPCIVMTMMIMPKMMPVAILIMSMSVVVERVMPIVLAVLTMVMMMVMMELLTMILVTMVVVSL